MRMKLHESEKSSVVAVCDAGLLGKRFEEAGRLLDLKNNAYFDDGKPATEKEVEAALRNATAANLVGEKATSVAVRMGIASKADVKLVCGIPHLQIYKV
jgi:hypothetical protein